MTFVVSRGRHTHHDRTEHSRGGPPDDRSSRSSFTAYVHYFLICGRCSLVIVLFTVLYYRVHV